VETHLQIYGSVASAGGKAPLSHSGDDKMFVGAILAIVAIYIIVTVESASGKIFGGGVVLIIAIILFLLPAFKKKKEEKD